MENKVIDESKQGEALYRETENKGGKKMFLESYGCQMNFSDSQIVGSIMTDHNFETTDKSIRDIIGVLKDAGKIQQDDIVINTASMPIKGRGRTNMIKITIVD